MATLSAPSEATAAPGSTSAAVPRGWLALALACLVSGFATAWLLRPLVLGPSDADLTFARDMVAHHQQAVEMALLARDRAADEELRIFALDMMLTQQAQIGQMQGWLGVWDVPLSGVEPPMGGHAVSMGMATAEQIDALRTLPDAEAEARFFQLMIPHHQGAVQMAEAALATTSRPEVRRLAQAILDGQQSEINYMQQQLARRGAAVPAPLPPMDPKLHPSGHDMP